MPYSKVKSWIFLTLLWIVEIFILKKRLKFSWHKPFKKWSRFSKCLGIFSLKVRNMWITVWLFPEILRWGILFGIRKIFVKVIIMRCTFPIPQNRMYGMNHFILDNYTNLNLFFVSWKKKLNHCSTFKILIDFIFKAHIYKKLCKVQSCHS